MPFENVAEAITALDHEFADFGTAFSRGEYALWVGSAISRDVVPDVKELMERVLELLRTKIDPSSTNCRFRAALEEVLDVAAITDEDRNTIDLTQPVHAWPARQAIVRSVINKYSDVLNVYPTGEAPDYLVWTGLDVPKTYGDSALEPDAEHYCIAILMLEGVAGEVLTTNWDGLIEAAMQDLVSEPDDLLKVAVTTEDLRKPARRSELVKFHGCAVRARADEDKYRALLIARAIQISGWATQYTLMKEHLQFVYSTKPALLVGLSAQDANIHTVFHQAIQNLHREWPSSPPAVVFANQRLDYHHKHVLQVTYGNGFAGNEDDISSGSLFAAFAKPALTALTLFTLTEKLASLLCQVPGLNPRDATQFQGGLRSARDALAATIRDERCFVLTLIDAVRLASNIFRRGHVPESGQVAYEPLSTRPIVEAIQDVDFPKEAIGRVALALALLARAQTAVGWSLTAGSCADPSAGTVKVTTLSGTSRVFFVNDAQAEARLRSAGYVDDDPGSAVLIFGNSVPPRATRSPRRLYGRTGRAEVRIVDVASLISIARTADEMFEAFTLQGAF
ncbi:MAG: SIR2 family protein [Hyphomicrobium sp.]|jgi:hypothetical protein